MNKRDLEILISRAKRLYKEVNDDLEMAKTKYQQSDIATANLLINSAIVKSNILIAERLDVIFRILTQEDL